MRAPNSTSRPAQGAESTSPDWQQLERSIRVRPAEPVPDLVASVVARARPARLGRGGWLRPALAWVAIVMFVQSVPALVLGETPGADTHLARHLGAFGAALAIGFAYAAWKPHRAFGMLPFTAALVATTVVSAVADAATGGREVLGETIHIVEIAGSGAAVGHRRRTGLAASGYSARPPERVSIRSSAVAHQLNNASRAPAVVEAVRVEHPRRARSDVAAPERFDRVVEVTRRPGNAGEERRAEP